MSGTSRDEMLRRQAEYAQAMSKEEIARRQKAAAGARSASVEWHRGQQAALVNVWDMGGGTVIVVPPERPTRTQRVMQWLSKVLP